MSEEECPGNAEPVTRIGRCPDERKDINGLRSVERAFSVIDAIASELRPKGLSDLARATGLAKSTMHRILRYLCASRLIAKSGDGYVLGSRLANLSRAVNSAAPGGDEKLLMPFLMSLYDATYAVVTLAILDGRHAVHSEKLFNHGSVEIAPQVVYRSPASLTPAGKVLLAYQRNIPRDETTETFLGSNVSIRQLKGELGEVRRTGLAYSKTIDSDRRVVSCAAAPVFGAEGDPVRAFSVTGVFHPNDEAKALIALRQNARSASRYLRWNQTRIPPAAS